jgi:glycosyltransferase involved in cell wall biosynthesis
MPIVGLHMDKKLKVCFFQAYTCDYIRSQTLLKGLKDNGVDVVECVVNRSSVIRYPLAIFKFIRTVRSCDVVVANYRSFEVLFLLKALTSKPIVYDPLFSIWQTVCEEKGLFGKESIIGKILFFMDRFNLKLADHVLSDSMAHGYYYCRTFLVDPGKITTIYTSCEDDIFFPRTCKSESSGTVVFWCGSGIPLQGLDVIYAAMKILARTDGGIVLRLAGSSGIISEIRKKAVAEGVGNIVFMGRLPRRGVVDEIACADICLGGHYSNIGKASNVVSGKVYEMIAVGKPVIVGDSAAVRELFTHKKDAFLCKMGSAESLADSILELSADRELSRKLAENGNKLYRSRLLPKHVTSPLVDVLTRLSSQDADIKSS